MRTLAPLITAGELTAESPAALTAAMTAGTGPLPAGTPATGMASTGTTALLPRADDLGPDTGQGRP